MALRKIPRRKILQSDAWKPPDEIQLLNCESNSWFNIKSVSCNFETTNFIKDHVLVRTKQYKINPTVNQRAKLLIWMKLYKIVYNKTIAYLRTHRLTSFMSLRPIITNIVKSNNGVNALIISSKCPKHTLDNAVKDVLKAYKTALANLKAKNIKYFRLRYKTDKCSKMSLVIENGSFSKNRHAFCYRALGVMNGAFPKPNHDVRLSYNKLTKIFVLHIPVDKHCKINENRLDICSLDPGVRTFQTLYSPNKMICELSPNNDKIKKLREKINDLTIKQNTEPSLFDKLRRCLAKRRHKLKNLVDDMHWKIANFLCKRFNNILIGKMSTCGIVKRLNHMTSVNKRLTYALSHFTFRCRLQCKAEEYGVNCREVCEAYTSKTCGNCGEINEQLRDSKIFTCPTCHFVIDRDIGAARNIFIKHM